MNFIRTHLITKIKDQVKEKQKVLKHEGFLFLDKPVNDGKIVINRINGYVPYAKEEVLPLNWYKVKGTSMLEIYSQLKDNSFFIYKLYEGKSHKMRIKKR